MRMFEKDTDLLYNNQPKIRPCPTLKQQQLKAAQSWFIKQWVNAWMTKYLTCKK